MHLVKWFRKNKMKLMAVVVIGLMIAFVGGSFLRMLGQRRTGRHKTVAYYGDNKKITINELNLARRELQILQMLRVNLMLAAAQDLHGMLLGELLFSEPATAPRMLQRIKQAIRLGEYRVSDKQLNDIYRRRMEPHLYWFLLKKETQQAGIRASQDSARSTLVRLIPKVAEGTTYSELMGMIVRRYSIPEKDILDAFAQLLAVLQYSKTICSNEDITTAQQMHDISRNEEQVNVEFVKFDAALFAGTQAEPTEQQIIEHFNKYKSFSPGRVSDENPYGFGYKLPDRARLQYIALRLDDVSETVAVPTDEETELYYQRYRSQYTEQIPSDPNDPNSPLVERIRGYAEVAEDISKAILRTRTINKTSSILQEARELAEADLKEAVDTDSAGLDAEQFKEISGRYETAAGQLSDKYKVSVYAGQTGLLSAEDMQADEYLGRMYLEGYGHNPPHFLNLVRLPVIIFAIDKLGSSELGPYDVPKPRMYETIGPFKDASGRVMMLARVTEAQKAAEPEGIDVSYSTKTISFDTTQKPADENTYSVRKKVIEDLKRLAATKTAADKADEFVKQAAEYGWEKTIDRFNKLYAKQDTDKKNEQDASAADQEDVNEPFRLQNLTGIRRLPETTLEMLLAQNKGDPAGKLLIDALRKERLLTNQFFSIVPEGAESIEALPAVIEVKQKISFYCIKSITINRLSQEQYEQAKAEHAYRQDFLQSQSLAAVHFNPERILKRMDFRPVPAKKRTTDVNVPA